SDPGPKGQPLAGSPGVQSGGRGEAIGNGVVPRQGGNASTGGASQPGAPTSSAPASDPATGTSRPEIRSFVDRVEPHVPLRSNSPDPPPRAGPPPLPPTILSILPEGTRVKANDVVCVLDASAFRIELLAQKIRYLQAKARVEQARSILESN